HHDRNLVLRRGPERAWRYHQIAVAHDRHREPAMLAIGQGRADRATAAIADAERAGIAEEVIVLIHLPELVRPEAARLGCTDERVILVLDDVPELHREPRRADRRDVPAGSRFILNRFVRSLPRFGELLAA